MFTFYYYLLSKRRKVFEREKRRERTTTTTALCLLGNDALFRDDFLCVRARAMIYTRVCVKKKEEITIIVFFLFPFSR